MSKHAHVHTRTRAHTNTHTASCFKEETGFQSQGTDSQGQENSALGMWRRHSWGWKLESGRKGGRAKEGGWGATSLISGLFQQFRTWCSGSV